MFVSVLTVAHNAAAFEKRLVASCFFIARSLPIGMNRNDYDYVEIADVS